MKKLLFLAVILSSVTFFACGGGSSSSSAPLSPKAFNDKAINIFKGANKTMDTFDAKITAGIKSNDLASITSASELASTEINAQIENLNALVAPQHGEEYKASVAKTLETVKSIIETGKKYGELKEGYSKSEFNALEKEYNKKRKQLSNELKDVAKAASVFTKATGK
jgi:hypothetical protein